jgi:hypothetical protein
MNNKKANSLSDLSTIVEVAATETLPEGTAPVVETVPEVTAAPAPKGFVPNMLEILATSKSRVKGQKLIRPGIGYTLNGANAVKLVGTGITPQMKVVLLILNENLTAEKPVISEPDLHALIVEAAVNGSLKTKQDPWRIFQYYRTELVKTGVVESVKI